MDIKEDYIPNETVTMTLERYNRIKGEIHDLELIRDKLASNVIRLQSILNLDSFNLQKDMSDHNCNFIDFEKIDPLTVSQYIDNMGDCFIIKIPLSNFR